MVTSAADSGPGTLREAINKANLQSGADVVEFSASLTSGISVASPLPISEFVEITAAGRDAVVIDGTSAGRLFEVAEAGNVDGLVLRNIVIQNAGDASLDGGAVHLAGKTSLQAFDTIFDGNVGRSGGAVYASNGNVLFDGCTFSGNSANGSGGAVWAGRTFIANDSSFEDNTAVGQGGAVLLRPVQDAVVDFDDSVLRGNSSGSNGGAIFHNGGATRIDLNLDHTIVEYNTAGTLGGGIYVGNGGHINLSRFRLSHNTALGGNQSSAGGGLYLYDHDQLNAEHGEISFNNLLGNPDQGTFNNRVGGGVYARQGLLRFVNVTLARNTAYRGAGLFIASGADRCDVVFTHSTISDNKAIVAGGGVAIFGGNFQLTLANSVLAGNYDPSAGVDDQRNDADLSSFASSVSLLRVNLLGPRFTGVPGTQNAIITTTPGLRPLGFHDGEHRTMPPAIPGVHGGPHHAFDNAAPAVSVNPGPDGIFGTSDDTPLTSDQTGRLPRDAYNAPDIGAAEAVLSGDANFDGKVDLADFVILRNHFGSGSLFAQGDFNGDGRVDLADFVLLRNNFGSAIDFS